jgi:TonB-dependent receptor
MTNLSSSLVIDTTRQGGDLRASSGLPTLRPFASDNFDLTAEWYLKDFSYVSASYFNKKVSDFIVETVTQSSINNVTDPSTGDDPNAADVNDQLAIFNITRPTNGETATVSGYEFALQYDFGNGWGIIANTTIVDSNAKLDPSDISQKFALTGLSDSKNALLYYEKDALQFRVSWSHRDAFLQSLVQILGPEPTFVRDYQQIDFSASYQLNNNYSVFIEGINISNESVLKHGRFSNQFLLAQQPGPRYALGIRGKL